MKSVMVSNCLPRLLICDLSTFSRNVGFRRSQKVIQLGTRKGKWAGWKWETRGQCKVGERGAGAKDIRQRPPHLVSLEYSWRHQMGASLSRMQFGLGHLKWLRCPVMHKIVKDEGKATQIMAVDIIQWLLVIDLSYELAGLHFSLSLKEKCNPLTVPLATPP